MQGLFTTLTCELWSRWCHCAEKSNGKDNSL